MVATDCRCTTLALRARVSMRMRTGARIRGLRGDVGDRLQVWKLLGSGAAPRSILRGHRRSRREQQRRSPSGAGQGGNLTGWPGYPTGHVTGCLFKKCSRMFLHYLLRWLLIWPVGRLVVCSPAFSRFG